MPTQPLRILFVEDLRTDQELAEWQLRAEGIDLISLRVETRETFLHALQHFKPDLIISDYSMPEFDGMQALKLTQELHRDIPFIVLTGSRNEDTAVECIKAGAYDYVIKEHMHRLPFAVQEALKQQQIRKEKELVEEQLRSSEVRYRGLFEDSPISLWEEDFSAVKRYIDDLRASGVKDFDTYFKQHPEEVLACSGLVKVVDVNQATLELFGATSKADMYDSLAAMLAEDHLGHFQKELVLIADGVTQFNLEAVNQTLDGRTIRLNLNWAAVPGHADDLSKVIVSKVDVTARRQAEEQLQASEVRYRGLFENSPISLWEEDFSAVKRYLDALRAGGVKDFDAYFIEHPEDIGKCANLIKVTGVNKATLELFGVASKEAMGSNQERMIPADHNEHFRKQLVLIAAGALQFTMEVFNQTVDGRVLTLNIYWAAVPGFTDDLSNVIVSMVDITARKQMEEVIRTSEVRYRGLFEDSPISIWEEDFSAVKRYLDELRAGGVKDFDAYFIMHPEELLKCTQFVKVLDVNKVTLEIFGVASKAEITTNLKTEISEDALDEFRKELTMIANGELNFSVEAVNRTTDGRLINLTLNWAAVPGYTHDLSKVIVSMMDVTARKQAETALLQKVDELQRFQRLTVGRELKMIELKQEINALLIKMGQPAKYHIAE